MFMVWGNTKSRTYKIAHELFPQPFPAGSLQEPLRSSGSGDPAFPPGGITRSSRDGVGGCSPTRMPVTPSWVWQSRDRRGRYRHQANPWMPRPQAKLGPPGVRAQIRLHMRVIAPVPTEGAGSRAGILVGDLWGILGGDSWGGKPWEGSM